MKLLEKNDYYKLIDPLKKVTFNCLFARSVVEQHISGKIYVDHPKDPQTFLVVHPYGMSLLFGDWNNKEFNEWFKDYALNKDKGREKHEWIQAFPNDWNGVLGELFGSYQITSSENIDNRQTGIIELNARINFKFNLNKYLDSRIDTIDSDTKIVRADQAVFHQMKGSVIPFYFWESAEDFNQNGVGFSSFYKNKLASTAYSSFIHEDKLELGIETIEEFRGMGLAQYSCSALIDYCIENQYEPIWSCRLQNISSYKLALKLGFEPTLEIPYYRLSN